MTLPVEVSAEATLDLTALAEDYDSRQAGLGDRLCEAFLRRVALSANFPLSGPVYHRELRKFLLRPFPVLLLYRVTAEAVEIVALVDARRRPASLRETLDNR